MHEELAVRDLKVHLLGNPSQLTGEMMTSHAIHTRHEVEVYIYPVPLALGLCVTLTGFVGT